MKITHSHTIFKECNAYDFIRSFFKNFNENDSNFISMMIVRFLNVNKISSKGEINTKFNFIHNFQKTYCCSIEDLKSTRISYTSLDKNQIFIYNSIKEIICIDNANNLFYSFRKFHS